MNDHRDLFGDDEITPTTELTRNADYARKFEEKKKRDELSRLEAKFGGEGAAEDEEDEEVEDEGNDEPQEWKDDFLHVVPLLHEKNPQLYDRNAHFFNGSKEEEEELRRQFHQAAEEGRGEGEGNDDLVRKKKKSEEEIKDDEQHFQEWATKRTEKRSTTTTTTTEQQHGNGNGEEILMRYWKEDANIDEGEKFLRKYIWDQLWLETNDNEEPSSNQTHSTTERATGVEEEEDDEDFELEREEEFERKYNFRFEEPDGTTIARYPRQIEESERVDKRAKEKAAKRKEKKQRKEQEKLEQQQELMRLRQLQKEKILEQLAKIKETAGTNELPTSAQRLLDEDYDPSQWEEQMQNMFDDNFYNQTEEEKPVFEEDPFIDNTEPLGRPQMKKPEEEEEEGKEETDEVLNDALESGNVLVGKHLKKKQKKKQQKEDSENASSKTAEEKARDLAEQYYSLDFEDIVGGIPCRFKYVEVEPDRSGLNAADILCRSDKELKKIMPLGGRKAKGGRGGRRLHNQQQQGITKKKKPTKTPQRNAPKQSKLRRILAARKKTANKRS